MSSLKTTSCAFLRLDIFFSAMCKLHIHDEQQTVYFTLTDGKRERQSQVTMALTPPPPPRLARYSYYPEAADDAADAPLSGE